MTINMQQSENRFVAVAMYVGFACGLLAWFAILIFTTSAFLGDTSSWPVLGKLFGIGLGIALLPVLWFGFAWVFAKIADCIRLANEDWIRRLIREELLAREAHLIQHNNGR